jgi:hypothetical protein
MVLLVLALLLTCFRVHKTCLRLTACGVREGVLQVEDPASWRRRNPEGKAIRDRVSLNCPAYRKSFSAGFYVTNS